VSSKNDKIILTIGEGRFNRLRASIVNIKSRLFTIITMNLLVISILFTLYRYILSLANKPEYYKIFIGLPIFLLLFSLSISLYGIMEKTVGKEIISYKKNYFEKYRKMTEENLYKKFVNNLQQGLDTNEKNKKRLTVIYDGSLIIYLSSLIIFGVYMVLDILEIIQ